MNKIELLAPAGDLEKLITAVNYGADAVYIGGKKLGLRANSKNFDYSDMKNGIEYAHDNNVKVYVTINIFAHNDDFDGIEEYFLKLEEIGVDAFIISDPGLFNIAREVTPNMEIHISTQANNTNYHSANFWHKLGAKRIILARELSLKEITEISKNTDADLEAFVHGAMCISYSGRCLLSAYMTGRDGNKGDCAHSCRWKYSLMEEKREGEYFPVYEDERGTYILNSKDLCMIEYLPELIDSGITSLKIEGRMKSPYYVGVVIKAYREAIDDYLKDKNLYESKKEKYLQDIKKTSYRDFTTGFYFDKSDEEKQVYGTSSYTREYDFIGIVRDYDEETGMATIEQRNKFVLGDIIEIFPKKGEGFFQKVVEMKDEDGLALGQAPHPRQIIKMKMDKPVSPYDMLRKEKL